MTAAAAKNSYDDIADAYAIAFARELDSKPFDRCILKSFGRLVLDSGGERVLDAGCGPGQAAAELARSGLAVDGVDRSPPMIEIARRQCPGIRFGVADMTELPFPDNAFHGLCAFYSIIHTPGNELRRLFTEFRRVLTVRGWLLLAFQTDAPTLSVTEALGHRVNLEFFRHDVTFVLDCLADTGFTSYAQALRRADAALGETASQAFLIARRHSVA